MRFHHQTKKVMTLILVSLSFLLLGYGLIYALAKPFIRPLSSIYSLITSEFGPDFNGIKKNLYSTKDNEQTDFIDLKDVVIPEVGDQYGKISISKIGLQVDLYYGDSAEILMHGVGQFQGSFLPGFNRTTLIAGHAVPYFLGFEELKIGDEIKISTHYGKFKYLINSIKVGKFNDESMYDLGQDQQEQLILYTCYPIGVVGFKTDRLFVYAKKISGTTILGV